ncbi:MAG TPA: type 4a pilus biogenesis protein PilO [Mycobacteriales bacterium]|nr:type 4a pilus biogenesis protein PilO [Mycobacteriales bacterium]
MTKTRQWTVFTAIAVLAVLVVGWFLLVKPQNSKVSTLKSQAATQQSSNAVLQSQIASLESEQRQLPQQQAALQKFASEVPPNASEPMLIRQLSAAAAGAGVDLVSITPGAPTVVSGTSTTSGGTTSLAPATSTANQLVQLPVSLAITGTFPNVESFFQALEKLRRSTLVTNWSLCPDPAVAGSSGSVSCALPATPSTDVLPPNAIGGTLSAYVFYSPPAGTSTTTTPTTATAPAPTTTPSATTTPAPGTSTPATSTATTPSTTGASSAPAS